MEQVLELRHIYYSYHTPEGETPALARYFLFSFQRRIHCHRRTVRLRQIHPAIRSSAGLITSPEKGSDPVSTADPCGKVLTNIGYMLTARPALRVADHLPQCHSSDWRVQHTLTARDQGESRMNSLDTLRTWNNSKIPDHLSSPAACGNGPPWSAPSSWNRISCFWMNHCLRWTTRPDSSVGDDIGQIRVRKEEQYCHSGHP